MILRLVIAALWLVAFLTVMLATGTLIVFICCETTLPPL